MTKKKKLSPRHQKWVDARKQFSLSHAQVQMARELGMNPKKFGSLANHKQQPWKMPLPQFIEHLYFKRFGKERPDNVRSVEEMVRGKKKRQGKRKAQEQAEKKQDYVQSSEGVSREYDDEIPF